METINKKLDITISEKTILTMADLIKRKNNGDHTLDGDLKLLNDAVVLSIQKEAESALLKRQRKFKGYNRIYKINSDLTRTELDWDEFTKCDCNN